MRKNQKIILQKARVKYKKVVKGASALALISVMGMGIVKFLPTVFDRVKAADTKDFSASDLADSIAHTSKKIVDVNNEILNKTSDSNEKPVPAEKETQPVTEETTQAPTQDNQYPKIFKVGCEGSEDVKQFLESPVGQYVYQYSSDYGVDPNVIAAMCKQESDFDHETCCPGGSEYDGHSVGIMQINPSNERHEAYNYNTGETDVVYTTLDNLCDLETNIQIGCMMQQNNLKHYYGNIYLAIEAHNFGPTMLDIALKRNGLDSEEVKTNYADTRWRDVVADVYYNPLNYTSNWPYEHYGVKDYVLEVVEKCTSDISEYRTGDEQITVNLTTGQIIEKKNLEVNNKQY